MQTLDRPTTNYLLWVDSVDYGTHQDTDSAFKWLDEHFPDWGDRDIYLEELNDTD